MQMTKRSTLGYLAIVASATGFGFMPIFATLSYRAGMTVETVLFLRFALATVILAPLAALQWRTHRVIMRRASVLKAVGLGAVLYTGEALTYFYAVKMVGAPLAVMLLYLYPALVALVESVLRRRPPSWPLIAAIILSFVGLLLTLGRICVGGNLPGILVGLLAAVVYVIYIFSGNHISQTMPPVVMTELMFLGSTVGLGLTGVAAGHLSLDFDPIGWVWVVGLSLSASVVGILCFFLAMERIGPTRASLGSTLEAVTTVVFSALILGAVLTPLQYCGAIMVLVAAIGGLTISGQQSS